MKSAGADLETGGSKEMLLSASCDSITPLSRISLGSLHSICSNYQETVSHPNPSLTQQLSCDCRKPGYPVLHCCRDVLQERTQQQNAIDVLVQC